MRITPIYQKMDAAHIKPNLILFAFLFLSNKKSRIYSGIYCLTDVLFIKTKTINARKANRTNLYSKR